MNDSKLNDLKNKKVKFIGLLRILSLLQFMGVPGEEEIPILC